MSVTFYPNYIPYAGFDKTAEPSVTVYTYTCSGGETTGPAYDLVDNRRGNLLTIACSGSSTACEVDFDLTANITLADFAIIDNHNFLTADCEVQIEYGGSAVACDSCHSGTLGAAMASVAAGAGNDFDFGAASNGIALFQFTTAQTENNWEINIDDGDEENFGANVTIGEIAIGVSFTPAINPRLNRVFSYRHQGIRVVESAGGQKYGYSNHTTAQRAWKMTWEYLSSTDKTALETVFNVTRGGKYPFYIDLGEAATPQLYYVRFVQDSLEFSELTKNVYKVSVMIEAEA